MLLLAAIVVPGARCMRGHLRDSLITQRRPWNNDGNNLTLDVLQTFEEEFGGKLPYSVGGLTGNTFDSHRLLSYAGSKFGAEKQNELVQALFRAYFSEVRGRS